MAPTWGRRTRPALPQGKRWLIGDNIELLASAITAVAATSAGEPHYVRRLRTADTLKSAFPVRGQALSDCFWTSSVASGDQSGDLARRRRSRYWWCTGDEDSAARRHSGAAQQESVVQRRALRSTGTLVARPVCSRGDFACQRTTTQGGTRRSTVLMVFTSPGSGG